MPGTERSQLVLRVADDETASGRGYAFTLEVDDRSSVGRLTRARSQALRDLARDYRHLSERPLPSSLLLEQVETAGRILYDIFLRGAWTSSDDVEISRHCCRTCAAEVLCPSC